MIAIKTRTIYTIGFSKKNLRKFIHLLTEADVQKVVDIRLHNTSQLSGYAKKDDLEYICELLGIGYQHVPMLAPTEDILKDYKQESNWDKYEVQFAKLLAQRQPVTVLDEDLQQYDTLCLLCSEDIPNKCHRRLVAEYLQAQLPTLAVRHLR